MPQQHKCENVVCNAMRVFIITISIVFLTLSVNGQKAKSKQAKSPLADTAYFIVPLHDIVTKKTVIVNVGEKAKIYISGDSVLHHAQPGLNQGYANDKFNRLISFFDSAFQRNDTVSIAFYTLSHLEYITSDQLRNGHAKVYYYRHNKFVDTISHRLERFGGNADRFFYLPDGRPFFAVLEMFGILDRNRDLFQETVIKNM